MAWGVTSDVAILAAIPRSVRSQRPPATQPECGTDAGYNRHQKAGEVACDPCLVAHRQADLRRYHARSKTWPIREWCRSAGLPVKRTGRIARSHRAAYNAAHPEEAS